VFFQAPSATVKSRARFAAWDYPAFGALTVLHWSVLAVIIVPWLLSTNWSLVPPPLLLVLVTIALELLLWEARWLALPFMRVPEPVAARPGWRVGVAVTYVPGTESLEMLERTVSAILALRYPHDTWVLDEGNHADVRALCHRMGARHFSRANRLRYREAEGRFKAHTKYGNYNAWLEVVGYHAYDIVVAVDSDHVLRPDYLDHVVGYFDDERVAFVQPAQAYYNQSASFIARAAAEETYSYFSSVQMAAYGIGYPIIVGCHNAHRVTALREVGGFPEHEADDLVLTLLYRAHGWRGVYLPKILARGLTPVSWIAYLQQQRRWARSVLDFKVRVFPKYSRRLPWTERLLTYVHGVYYLRGPLVALQLALLAIMLASSRIPQGTGMDALGGIALIWITLAGCELYRQRFYLDRDSEAGVHWRASFVSFVKWPYFVVAFWDALRREYGTYTLTPKAGRRSEQALGFGTVHLVVGAVITLAWFINVASGPSSFVPIHVAAALAVVSSLLAAWTSTWRFAPPFQASRLRRTWRVLERAVALEVQREAVVPLVAAPPTRVRRRDRRPDSGELRTAR
jgi:cellulose synthase (UDP-forming)